MAQIDTSFYQRQPTLAEGAGSLVQGLQNYKNMQMQDIARQNALAQQQDMERKRRQQQAFTQDFKDMGYQQGVSDPREIQDLYAEHFPMKHAEMQMKQQMSQDPYAMQRLALQQQRLQQGQERLGLQQSAEQRRSTYAPLNFKLKQKQIDSAIKGRNFNQAAKLEDQRIAMLSHNQSLEDEQWERDYKTNKSEFEYKRKQEQLLGEIPNIVAKNYIGGSNVGGKNLTPENVKTITAGTEGASKILDNTDKLMDLLNKHGLEQLPGAEREQMKTLIGNIALQYKSKEFANLGVLTGPDLDILLSVTGDPTSFTALTADIQKQKLGQFREGLINGYNKALLTRGFNPVNPDELSSMGVVKSSPSVVKSAIQRAKERRGN